MFPAAPCPAPPPGFQGTILTQIAAGCKFRPSPVGFLLLHCLGVTVAFMLPLATIAW
jgi:hypothetical protein